MRSSISGLSAAADADARDGLDPAGAVALKALCAGLEQALGVLPSSRDPALEWAFKRGRRVARGLLAQPPWWKRWGSSRGRYLRDLGRALAALTRELDRVVPKPVTPEVKANVRRMLSPCPVGAVCDRCHSPGDDLRVDVRDQSSGLPQIAMTVVREDFNQACATLCHRCGTNGEMFVQMFGRAGVAERIKNHRAHTGGDYLY
jgi:hypothetical protein